jgi:hypothetical protein
MSCDCGKVTLYVCFFYKYIKIIFFIIFNIDKSKWSENIKKLIWTKKKQLNFGLSSFGLHFQIRIKNRKKIVDFILSKWVNILNTGQVVTSTLLPTDMKVSNISFPNLIHKKWFCGSWDKLFTYWHSLFFLCFSCYFYIKFSKKKTLIFRPNFNFICFGFFYVCFN